MILNAAIIALIAALYRPALLGELVVVDTDRNVLIAANTLFRTTLIHCSLFSGEMLI
jgi:hypothetical protein